MTVRGNCIWVWQGKSTRWQVEGEAGVTPGSARMGQQGREVSSPIGTALGNRDLKGGETLGVWEEMISFSERSHRAMHSDAKRTLLGTVQTWNLLCLPASLSSSIGSIATEW